MALENWVDKQDGIDDILAEDINSIANGVIETQKEIDKAVAIEQKRSDNTFANALKSSKSGSAILIDDISPVTHEMSVKISSDTVTDLTAVKVTRYGKNLIQTNIIEVTSPAGVENLIWQGNISGKLSFSLDNSEYTLNPSNVNSANFKFVLGDGTAKYLAAHAHNIYLNTSSPLKEIYFLNWGQGTGVIKNIQLEIGSSVTDYEPYVEPTEYTPNADGTVNGVTSLYPNTTLMTDTEGVIITCEYNKDINTFSGADVRVPTKTSELINDSNFATQDYVDEEIANFDFIKIVTELPETGLINRTYFVPKSDPTTNDLYDEYMWVDGKWELIATKQIEVDLTNYYTKSEVDEKMVVDQTYDKNSQNAQSGKAVNEAIMLRKDLSDMEDIMTITMDADTLVYTFPSFSDYKILYLIVTKTYKATELRGSNWFRFGAKASEIVVKLTMARTEYFLDASMPTGFTGQFTATNNPTQPSNWQGIVVADQDLNKPFRGTPTLTLANSDWAAYYAECGTVIYVKGVRR